MPQSGNARTIPGRVRHAHRIAGLRAEHPTASTMLHRDDGQIYHIRKATRPEPHQQILYNALGLPHLPGKTEKTLIDPRAEVSQM